MYIISAHWRASKILANNINVAFLEHLHNFDMQKNYRTNYSTLEHSRILKEQNTEKDPTSLLTHICVSCLNTLHTIKRNRLKNRPWGTRYQCSRGSVKCLLQCYNSTRYFCATVQISPNIPYALMLISFYPLCLLLWKLDVF